MDEMVVAAQKVNGPAEGVNGFVPRGLKNANVVI
jgi:hypothetical protein